MPSGIPIFLAGKLQEVEALEAVLAQVIKSAVNVL
jgi:hypothetical protein